MVVICRRTSRCLLLSLLPSLVVFAVAGLTGCTKPTSAPASEKVAVRPAAARSASAAQPILAIFRPGASKVRPAEIEHLRRNLRRVVAQSRDRVFPALVNIHVVTVDYWGGKEDRKSVV